MNEDEFKKIYKELKSIIEEVDPAGFGAEGEYDDVLFSIIRDNQNLAKEDVFVQNTARIIAERFGLNVEDLVEPVAEFAKKVYQVYPQGLR